jgi:DNA-binding GntR family transcriptional regulator
MQHHGLSEATWLTQKHDRPTVTKKTPSKSTEADRVFDSVVSAILAGTLRPRERISERDLVSRFGVSRTPVREAIKRLFERGLVQAGPKGVAVVIEVGADDLRKLYDVRLQMESWAALATVANVTDAEIERMRKVNKQFGAALQKRDLVRMLEVRAEFHAVAAEATRNRWLAEMLIMLREKSYVVRHFHWQDFERAAQTLRIHEQMLVALEKRDKKAYHDLVILQIQGAIDSFSNQLRVPVINDYRSAPAVSAKRSKAAAQ